jgi:hypothetical protein
MLLTLDLVGGLRFVGRCIARDASRRVDLVRQCASLVST